MRLVFVIPVLAFAVFQVVPTTAEAVAVCDPRVTVCAGYACDTVGVTVMDFDQQNLVACLRRRVAFYTGKP